VAVQLYNTRYGLAALPLLAFTLGALVALGPGPKSRAALLALVVALAVLPWAAYPRAEAWICWKESQVNSAARRAWTAEVARFLKEHYRGGGIAMSFSDTAGALRQAGIPFREIMHEGSGPLWNAVLARPELFLRQEWAIALRARWPTPCRAAARNSLRLPADNEVKAPVVKIWRLSSSAARLPLPGTAVPSGGGSGFHDNRTTTQAVGNDFLFTWIAGLPGAANAGRGRFLPAVGRTIHSSPDGWRAARHLPPAVGDWRGRLSRADLRRRRRCTCSSGDSRASFRQRHAVRGGRAAVGSKLPSQLAWCVETAPA
jgi:hypothetical protein